MKTWFVSDYHFNHANIIKYCHRPFKDVVHMNETIIKNHNMRVSPEDMVFFVGDFCFKNSPGGKAGEGLPQKAEYFINQLNGRFVFIKGNHDRNNSLKTNIEKVIIRYGGHQICLVHNPTHANPYFEFNFVGHVHNAWRFKELTDKSYMINVGVDMNNFHPVSFEEIMKAFRQWKKSQKSQQLKNSEEKNSTNGLI